MKSALNMQTADPGLSIVARGSSAAPIFTVAETGQLALRAPAVVNLAGAELTFDGGVAFVGSLEPGTDYVVLIGADDALIVDRWRHDEVRPVLGGFHFAPGGNATARSGGDSTPAVNPCSIWDIGFRPACADPRGMTRVEGVRGFAHLAPFWVDIYLLNRDHLQRGTSVFGAEIADGARARPRRQDGTAVDRLDHPTAAAIMAGHGKQLLAFDEFCAAAYGVTERAAAAGRPSLASLDAPRTSRCGVMQATGNLYVWGHDGDPDAPRASIFGGYWGDGGFAGSRYANVGYWPGNSSEWIGARGRSDHLQPDGSAR